MRSGLAFAFLITFAPLLATCARAGDCLNIENVPAPAPLDAKEPFASSFSLESAARSLDVSALHWQKIHKCAACHTMVPYLMARPTLAAIAPEPPEVRQFFETIAEQPLEAIQAGSPELVGAAAALAFHDQATTGKLSVVTRKALDRMWTLQRPDGGFNGYKIIWIIRGVAECVTDLARARMQEINGPADDPSIRIELPKPTIHAARLDHSQTRTYDLRAKGWLPIVSVPESIRTEAMQRAQQIVQRTAEREEYLLQARRQTEAVLSSFYAAAGYRTEIVWHDSGWDGATESADDEPATESPP